MVFKGPTLTHFSTGCLTRGQQAPRGGNDRPMTAQHRMGGPGWEPASLSPVAAVCLLVPHGLCVCPFLPPVRGKPHGEATMPRSESVVHRNGWVQWVGFPLPGSYDVTASSEWWAKPSPHFWVAGGSRVGWPAAMVGQGVFISRGFHHNLPQTGWL